MLSMKRRDLIRVSALTAAGTLAAACAVATPAAPTAVPAVAAPATAVPAAPAAPTAAPAAPAAPTAAPSKYAEAPMLAARVAKGELPPVAERLPENPHVCPVMEMTGKYGGLIRRSFKGVSDRVGPSKLQEASFLWYNPDLSLRACLAESWETNADASEWTFHLRKGARWSDGSEFTAAAVSWYWQHELQNGDLTPSTPSSWSNGSPKVLATLDTPDDYTVVLAFAAPNPFFGFNVTRSSPFVPGHYLEQFHAEFADKDALAKMVTQMGVDSWAAVYMDRNTWYMNPDLPTMGAWNAKNQLSEEYFLMERNPYFFQVDAEGQQLPYVDRITHRLHSSADVFAMWVINGEIDFFGRQLTTTNYTLYKENEEKGDYKVVFAMDSMHRVLHLNMTTADARTREFFSDRNVRIAISQAINRTEIAELVFDGLCEGRQYSPIKGSPQYYPKQAYAHTEYDPDLANRLLDEAGYAARDADGFRLWKDGSGETMAIELITRDIAGDPYEDVTQMVVKYLADVGLNMAHKNIERSLFEERTKVNDMVAHLGPAVRTILPMNPNTEFDGRFDTRSWGCAWSLYRQNPSTPHAEPPPDGHWLWKIWENFDQIWKEGDEKKRNDLFYAVLDIWAEELPCIGILGQFPAQVIVKNGLRNYVGGYPMDDPLGDDALLCPQTLFWEEPEKHS